MFADLSADLSGTGGLELEELQNDKTDITTESGCTVINKLQSLCLNYHTNSGPLRITKKVHASVNADGEVLVRIYHIIV